VEAVAAVRLLGRLRARLADRRARRAITLAEQAKLTLEREGRGLPGAETHGTPPHSLDVHGGF
jgi:hypothetical protein